jgi:hypothetical protein
MRLEVVSWQLPLSSWALDSNLVAVHCRSAQVGPFEDGVAAWPLSLPWSEEEQAECKSED